MFKKGKFPTAAQESNRSRKGSAREKYSNRSKRRNSKRFKVPKLDLSQDIDGRSDNGLVDEATVKAKIDFATLSQATTVDQQATLTSVCSPRQGSSKRAQKREKTKKRRKDSVYKT